MSALAKRALGVVAMLAGVGLLVVGVGQFWMTPTKPFQPRLLIRGIVGGCVLLYFGRKWFFNFIRLDVIGVDPASPEVAEARQKAQASIGRLWEYLAANRYECYVKFPMATGSGGTEHIWAVVHSKGDEGVVVSLVNDPVDRPKGAGERQVVAYRDIEDWQVVVSEAEIHGGYSVRALEKIALARGYRISRADRKRLRAFVDLEAA